MILRDSQHIYLLFKLIYINLKKDKNKKLSHINIRPLESASPYLYGYYIYNYDASS
jgi:hypothetical protein